MIVVNISFEVLMGLVVAANVLLLFAVVSHVIAFFGRQREVVGLGWLSLVLLLNLGLFVWWVVEAVTIVRAPRSIYEVQSDFSMLLVGSLTIGLVFSLIGIDALRKAYSRHYNGTTQLIRSRRRKPPRQPMLDKRAPH